MAEDVKEVKSCIYRAITMLCSVTETPLFNPFGTVPLPALADRIEKGQERYIVATGSYASSEWQPGDDVRLVLVSKATQKTMWKLLEEKFYLNPITDPNSATIELSAPVLSMSKQWQPSMLAEFKTLSQKNKADCKFYLHYCRFPALFNIHNCRRFPRYNAAELSPGPAQVANLHLILDTQLIAGVIDPGRSSEEINSRHAPFRHQYSLLRRWAKARGVLSSRLGFLDSECLASLVHKAMQTAENRITRSDPSEDDQILQNLLAHLKFSISVDNRAAIGVHKVKIKIDSPAQRLVSEAIIPANIGTIETVLRNNETYEAFLQGYKWYLQIGLSCWETSNTRQEYFNSTIVPNAVKNIASNFPFNFQKEGQAFGVYGRLWPAPIYEDETITYAIGLSGPLLDESSNKAAEKDCLWALGKQFEERLRTVFFLDKSTYIMSFVTVRELRAFLDKQNETVAAGATTAPPEPAQQVGESSNSSGRFRTAAETISRLRYDQSHASIEYDVGYMDRFDGLVWMGLENWGGKAVEEDDFVPEHRVKLIKRREDGFVVWDRENRVDRT